MKKPLQLLMLVFILVLSSRSWAADPFGEIQKAQDPKHTPVIQAPDRVKAGEPFKVTVKIGEVMHPSQAGHFIQWIELYANEVQLARTSLTPTLTLPEITFTLTLQDSTTLRALSQPNHSAAWESTKKIAIAKE